MGSGVSAREVLVPVLVDATLTVTFLVLELTERTLCCEGVGVGVGAPPAAGKVGNAPAALIRSSSSLSCSSSSLLISACTRAMSSSGWGGAARQCGQACCGGLSEHRTRPQVGQAEVYRERGWTLAWQKHPPLGSGVGVVVLWRACRRDWRALLLGVGCRCGFRFPGDWLGLGLIRSEGREEPFRVHGVDVDMGTGFRSDCRGKTKPPRLKECGKGGAKTTTWESR